MDLSAALLGNEVAHSPDLLARAKAGDAEAFCLLCSNYEARLLRQAQVLCGEPGLAEELAHETLVEAWRSLRRYDGRSQFFTWLCAILLHRQRNRRRLRWFLPLSSFGFKGSEQHELLTDSAVDPNHTPDQVAERQERDAMLRHCLKRLPAKQREVIYLRFYVDESLESIAAALRCSVGTVKSRLFYALDKLRAMRELTGGL